MNNDDTNLKQPVVDAQAAQGAGMTDEEILDNMSDDEMIDLFIKGLMIEKGIATSGGQLEQDVFDDLKGRLMEQIDRSLVAELPDDKLTELDEMAKRDGKIAPEVVAQMVQDAGLDVSEIMGVTMERFREIYLGDGAQDAVLDGVE